MFMLFQRAPGAIFTNALSRMRCFFDVNDLTFWSVLHLDLPLFSSFRAILHLRGLQMPVGIFQRLISDEAFVNTIIYIYMLSRRNKEIISETLFLHLSDILEKPSSFSVHNFSRRNAKWIWFYLNIFLMYWIKFTFFANLFLTVKNAMLSIFNPSKPEHRAYWRNTGFVVAQSESMLLVVIKTYVSVTI